MPKLTIRSTSTIVDPTAARMAPQLAAAARQVWLELSRHNGQER